MTWENVNNILLYEISRYKTVYTALLFYGKKNSICTKSSTGKIEGCAYQMLLMVIAR